MSSDYQRAPHEWVDPRRVAWAPTPVDPAAVEHYKQHPNRPYGGWLNSDGDPFIIRKPTGELVGCNGKHRAIAAAETGRKLWARVHAETAPGDQQPAADGRQGTSQHPAGRHRSGRVESNDVELMYTVAGNAMRCGYLLAGPSERVYARDSDPLTTVVPVPRWEDDAVHQLLGRRWLTRGSLRKVTCGAAHMSATTVLVPPATRARVNRWRH